MSQKYKRGNVLSCTMKKPVDLYAKSSDGKDKASCGVSVVDITFPNFEFVDIGDITFKNNYTGFISIKLRSNKDGNQGDPKWLTCIKLTQLMPDVHCDVSSQDYYTFTRDQMLVLPDKVTALRLVLQQPSTVWANFGVDNVTITEYNEERVTIPPMVGMARKTPTQIGSDTSVSLMPVDEIAAGLQRLWALTAKVQENQTESALGRFDVDGSYEVNLLSYT
eukprot:XP_011675647.1 PREDICTED: nicolin-1 [Strongylocentrotus purpuratus]